MVLAPRLDLRQTQSLVMTPQLQQAIKLLALSNLEIETFVSEAIESNPLLEEGGGEDAAEPPSQVNEAAREPVTSDELMRAGAGEADAPLDIDPAALDRDRDTGDRDVADRPLSEGGADWAVPASGAGGDPGTGLEEHGNHALGLAEHLEAQVGVAARDPRQAFIARTLVSMIEDTGYLTEPLSTIADMLGVPLAEMEAALRLVQSLDPIGVGARDLAECLALQARDADRYDPCMALMIDHLELLARGEVSQLKRICNVDDEDFADMVAELRGYDPKPGLRFGASEAMTIVPDILVRAAAGKQSSPAWDIALNPATVPRLVVNRDYFLELRGTCGDDESKGWLGEKLADANWLIKALDQRQRTILKVAAEIVRRQEGFFLRGVSELRPLTMRVIAETIGMHESTVSRVAANKYLACDRGTFELRFFFTSGVGGSEGEAASSAAVKARLKALIDGEAGGKVLSDDKLVELLRADGYDLARRTVAKYRESIGIGSSVERRRMKRLAGA